MWLYSQKFPRLFRVFSQLKSTSSSLYSSPSTMIMAHCTFLTIGSSDRLSLSYSWAHLIHVMLGNPTEILFRQSTSSFRREWWSSRLLTLPSFGSSGCQHAQRYACWYVLFLLCCTLIRVAPKGISVPWALLLAILRFAISSTKRCG